MLTSYRVIKSHVVLSRFLREQGLSLIELLVGLFLVSLISTMMMHHYLVNQRYYAKINEALQHEMDVQWVRDLLADSIRKAGFTPCANIEQLTRQNKLMALEITPHESLKINRMSDRFSELLNQDTNQHLLVSNEVLFHVPQTILIADCSHAEVQHLKKIEKTAEGTVLTLQQPLIFSYSEVTYVGQWLEEEWFIRTNQQKRLALYYKQTHPEELTSSIQSLHVKKRLIAGKKVVDVGLGLNNGQEQVLRIVVRS